MELLLLSFLNQTVLHDEIIITDDGSWKGTKMLIEIFQEKNPIPFVLIWYEDNGFSLATIKDKASAKSKFDYVIQIDGDIIKNKKIIIDHLIHVVKDQLLFGSRINIKKYLL